MSRAKTKTKNFTKSHSYNRLRLSKWLSTWSQSCLFLNLWLKWIHAHKKPRSHRKGYCSSLILKRSVSPRTYLPTQLIAWLECAIAAMALCHMRPRRTLTTSKVRLKAPSQHGYRRKYVASQSSYTPISPAKARKIKSLCLKFYTGGCRFKVSCWSAVRSQVLWSLK